MKITKFLRLFVSYFFMIIVFISCDDQSQGEFNDDNFIIFPNDGEALVQGDTYSLKWIDNISSTVSINLIGSNSNVFSIAKNIQNTGEFSWTVPDTLEEVGCSIKVSSNNNDFIYSESENKFAIVGISDTSSFIDPRDGQVYKTVKINDQWWMAENFNYNSPGSYCYSNDESYCDEFGRLYTLYAANEYAPPGWHLPSDFEWIKLERYLSVPEEDLYKTGARGANTNDLLCNNKKIGFNLKYAGYATTSWRTFYYSLNASTYLWTSTLEEGTFRSTVRHLVINADGIERIKIKTNSYLCSVRYIKDSELVLK